MLQLNSWRVEGTTAAGKTTVGVFKFMLLVAESTKKYHIIAAKDTGTAEKNIINKDLGILDNFGKLTTYNGNGSKDEKIPHIVFHAKGGDKIIYIMGYGDATKWKKALGGQYGCLYIDEINTADIEFVRESAMRCDYFMATLNPDDPKLPVYTEYVNCSRPLPEYEKDAPDEINSQLNSERKPMWTHWFFSFKDNLGLTKEKVAQIILNVPKGTKLYKNKILGLRGRATGLVMSNFDRNMHVKTEQWAKQFIEVNRRQQPEYFVQYTAGLDTSYSQKSADTIAMSFAAITNRGRYVLLNEKVYSNRDLQIPISPSDTVVNFIEFLDRNSKKWGQVRHTFIDCADEGTIMEFAKYKRSHNNCIYMFNPSYKIPIIDRINLQLGWMAYDDARNLKPCFYVLENCKSYIDECEVYSWNESKDNTPEDANDHMINSVQYNWIPYLDKIKHEE